MVCWIGMVLSVPLAVNACTSEGEPLAPTPSVAPAPVEPPPPVLPWRHPAPPFRIERPADAVSRRIPADLPLPSAARQTREGYWLGAMLQPSDVPVLADLGIRLVLSAQEPSADTLRELAWHGIEQVSVPMSDRFLHGETILQLAERYDESQIYIHCQYGADRTGAIAAFLLVLRHGWTIGDAFYSVLYASPDHAAALAELLAGHDLPDVRPSNHPSVGFYSVSAAGRSGGLKTISSGGARLVTSTIEAIEAIEARRSGRERIPWDGTID